MKVGFTGSGIYSMTPFQVENVVSNLLTLDSRRGEMGKFDGPITEVHHGDCVKADAEFHDLVREHLPHVKIIIHPPTENRRRAFCKGDVILDPQPFLDRNHHIVDAVDEMLATPGQQTEIQRSGTWATIRYANKKKIPVTILYPTEKPEKKEDKSKPDWITDVEWRALSPKSRVHIRAFVAINVALAQEYDKLRSAALMAREELVFGGDWETARKKIDEALPKEKQT